MCTTVPPFSCELSISTNVMFHLLFYRMVPATAQLSCATSMLFILCVLYSKSAETLSPGMQMYVFIGERRGGGGTRAGWDTDYVVSM